MTDNEEKFVSLHIWEDDYEYSWWGDLELWGVIGADGIVKQIKPDEVLPVGTELYVRVK